LATPFSISPPQDDVRAAAISNLGASRGATDAGSQAGPPGANTLANGQQAPTPPGQNRVAELLTELFQLLQRGEAADWENFQQFLGAIEQVISPVTGGAQAPGAGGQPAPSGLAALGPAPQGGPPVPGGLPPGAGAVPPV
jgi:hypothetical protein